MAAPASIAKWSEVHADDEEQFLRERLKAYVQRDNKVIAGEDLCKQGKVSALHEHAEGKIEAEVQGSETYHVSAILLDDGLWGTTSCSCPDGARTGGKCKHVVALLLKAARSRADSKAHSSSSVIVLDDDDDRDKAALAGVPQPRTKENNAPSSSHEPKAPQAAPVRKLPAWLSGAPAAKKPAPGTSTAARAAAKLAKDPPGKRKARPDDDDDDDVHLRKVPKARRAARRPPKKDDCESAATRPLSAASKATDFVSDDMGVDFLNELAGSGGAHDAVGQIPRNGNNDGNKRREVIALDSDGDGVQARGQKQSKEVQPLSHVSAGCDKHPRPRVATDSLSKESSQSSAVPDTPERSCPGGQDSRTGLPAEAPVETRAKAVSVGVEHDGDSSSDSDEDPKEKFERKFQERMRGNRAHQGPKACLPDAAVPDSVKGKRGDSGQNRAECEGVQSPNLPLKGAKPNGDACDDDDDITLGGLLQKQAFAQGSLASHKRPSLTESGSGGASPPPRPRPATTTFVSNKPTMSLAERMKQLRES